MFDYLAVFFDFYWHLITIKIKSELQLEFTYS